MAEPVFSVIVPASTANLGPGFDSVGLAVGLYMTVDVFQGEEWKITYHGDGFGELATGDNNLIIKTIIDVADQHGCEVPILQLLVQSDIPLGKGLGSSAAAIAAGIEIANHLLALNLSINEKVRIGSELEGHADNISAAFLAG